MWTDKFGNRRGDDEEYDEARDAREAEAQQKAIDDACYSPDPTTQYLRRSRYYDRQNKKP